MSYFPPSYFGGVQPPAFVGTGASTYFPRSFFGGSVPGAYLSYPTTSPATPPETPPDYLDPEAPQSDAKVLAWVRDELIGSGLFEQVRVGPQSRAGTMADLPSAWVYPVSFAETDEVDPIEITRTLRFLVQVSIRVDDPDDDLLSIDRLDTLSNQVADLVLIGPPGCLPGLARLESGRYQPDGTSQRADAANLGQVVRMVLNFALAYLVEGRSGRDEDS